MRREQDGAIITQFDYPTCESLGLIKMDFLGLRNLTVLDDALANITAATAASTWCWRTWRSTTRPTYALLGRGDTLGVFQLDGGPMRQLLRSMRPDSFADISAVLALYRPGPDGRGLATTSTRRRKTGREDGHLDPSRAGRAAGRDPGRDLRADRLPGAGAADRAEGRRLLPGQGRSAAQGDGQEEEGGARRRVRAVLRGGHGGQRLLSARRSQTLWDILVPFSDYAFNRAHTAAYGLVSYWTAYLKANYPARVHGRAAHLGGRRQGQDRDLPGRVPPDGHPGAAAGRQRVRGQLHPGRHRHPVRPDRGPQRRAQRGRRHRRGPRGARQGGRLLRLPGRRAAGGLQQAGDRVADQGRGVRLDGPHPARR